MNAVLKITSTAALLAHLGACAQVTNAVPPAAPATTAATPNVPAATATANTATPAAQRFDSEQMVNDMMAKIRKFLQDRPQHAEEVLEIFDLKESERVVRKTGEAHILTIANFPLSSASTWDNAISIDVEKKIFTMGLDFYKPAHPRPAGSPWCFPLNPLLKLLVDMNFEPKVWDNRYSTHVTYIRQVSQGKYDEVTPVFDGSCLNKFLYGPVASFTHIKQ